MCWVLQLHERLRKSKNQAWSQGERQVTFHTHTHTHTQTHTHTHTHIHTHRHKYISSAQNHQLEKNIKNIEVHLVYVMEFEQELSNEILANF